MITTRPQCLAVLAFVPATVLAQPYDLTMSSFSCGGSAVPVAAGPYTLQSCIGDPLAGAPGNAGPYGLATGFLAIATGGGASCYANCDNSTAAPVLNVADFTCFLQKYAAGDPYANCDASTATPALNVADFTCFLQKYAAGCTP